MPIMVGGVLYTPTLQHTIVALEPETGKEIWKYDLGRAGAPLRGVTYWAGDKDSPPQILAGTSDGRLIALNAKTGKLVPGFGNEGVVDLRPGVADKFPNAPVSHELARSHLPQPDHHRRAGSRKTIRTGRPWTCAPGISAPANWSGRSIPSRIRASPAMKPGPRTTG